jgi:hypothetical protein
MNRNRLIVVAFLSLIALTRLYGGGFEADIPFEFHAGAKVLPPGTYSFSLNDGTHEVSVAHAGKLDVRMPVVTRLGRRDSKDEGTLVFDKYKGVRMLSEVWIPLLDGVLVHIIPEEHTHEMVSVLTRGSPLPTNS